MKLNRTAVGLIGSFLHYMPTSSRGKPRGIKPFKILMSLRAASRAASLALPLFERRLVR
jgi:hypothetical protein